MGGLGDTDSPNSEISELKSEGLVSSNLQRFASGNILGSHHSSSHIPAKLIETNYVDKGHIGAVSQKVVIISNLLIYSLFNTDDRADQAPLILIAVSVFVCQSEAFQKR